ncbi:MAG TPA: hypothetical protein ENJ80_00410 [Gammaproteobacteria bacterium]|nr:hypothetical protein [Gammaproteobacteria bacterium]
MAESPRSELHALLFGEPPYERENAPELELLADIAPALDGETLLSAINVVCNYLTFVDPDRRVHVLVCLIAPLPSAQQEQALRDVLPLYPDVVRELDERLLECALRAIQGIEGWAEENKVIALATLLDRLPREGADEVYLNVLSQLADGMAEYYDARRAVSYLLKHFPGMLPGDLAARLLSSIHALAGPQLRATLLLQLIPCMGGEQREQALAEARALVNEIPEPLDRAAMLVELSDCLTGADQIGVLKDAFAIARADDEDYSRRLAVLANLSLRVDEPLKGQALAAAVEPYEQGRILWPSGEVSLAQAFIGLAAEIPEKLKPAYRQQIQALNISQLRQALDIAANFLSDVAPYLSESQLAAVLHHVLETSYGPSIERDFYLLSKFAPFLSSAHLDEVLELAIAMEDEPSLARILMVLAAYFPPPLLDKAIFVAQRYLGRWWGGRVLGVLIHHLPARQRQAFALDAYDDVSAGHIRQLLSELPVEERRRIVMDFLGAIEGRYGGGAEAPAASDTELSDAVTPYDDLEMSAPDAGHNDEPEDRPVAQSAPPTMEDLATAAESSSPSSENVVNTGFAPRRQPLAAVDAGLPLQARHDYYFWLEVGTLLPQAIDVVPSALPMEHLPSEARLSVVLFDFEGEIRITPSADIGELQLLSDDSVRVTRPVARPENLLDPSVLERRLFFPVTMPDKQGSYRLRCNIYYQRVLIQSHLVQVRVTSNALSAAFYQFRGRVVNNLFKGRVKPALQTVCDFTLSHHLESSRLSGLKQHRLSVMLNDNGNGNIGFRFFAGEDDEYYKQDAVITDDELQNLIDKARGTLRKATWGDSKQWRNQKYRYDGPADLDRLQADLVNFAKWGYRFYDAIIDRLAGGSMDPRTKREAVQRLQALMAEPGFVQISSKVSARQVVPVAMFYDHPLETTLPIGSYKLCPNFLSSLEGDTLFMDSDCFHGACPSKDNDDVICPSGFWGYRHAIGMPVSVDAGSEFTPSIEYDDTPALTMAVSTDPDLILRIPHEQALHRLLPGAHWHVADSREEALDLMGTATSHVVYFYCHGGVIDDIPYLQVGPPNERGITRDVLRNKDIFWYQPQPLVFVNGCHTTALEPEKALDLVSGFVQTANAAGVIGTEITVFEPLACRFAEECLVHFFQGEAIGESVRRARLKLLQEGNPLGLAYIPFVVASLSLRQRFS